MESSDAKESEAIVECDAEAALWVGKSSTEHGRKKSKLIFRRFRCGLDSEELMSNGRWKLSGKCRQHT
jgi:hypothetical protein